MPRLATSLAQIAALVGAGALLYVGAIMWSGSAATFEAIARIGWTLIGTGTAVATSAYLIRFVRWQNLLQWLGHRLPRGFNLRVYLAGLALTSSPGKLGETVRTVLLLPRGVVIPHSLAAFFADRLSDVIGVALLGSVAGWILLQRQRVLEAILILVLGASLAAGSLLRSRGWQEKLARIDRHSRVGRMLAALSLPASAWAVIWSVPRSLLCVVCAFLAYGLQALVFAAYVSATGTALPLAQCVGIFASSTLIGAASMVPGGLGAMEASLVYQLVDAGMPRDAAVAAALVTRASTLWFGLLLGSLMLLTFSRNAPAGAQATASRPSKSP